MTHHLVLGAGGVGRSTTAELVALGHTVTLASRSGRVAQPRSSPWAWHHRRTDDRRRRRHRRRRRVSVDAGDAAAVTALARGAASIVNAVNPPSYTTWDTDWPPVAAATLAAAEATGAGLVIIGNLYGYGEVEAPMHEDDPMRPAGHKGRLRADMWTEALARHEAGRLRVTELRSSDYFGPGTTPRTSYLNDIVVDPLLAGRSPFVPVGRADVPHSWTYVPDVGRLAARVATGDDGLGTRLARSDRTGPHVRARPPPTSRASPASGPDRSACCPVRSAPRPGSSSRSCASSARPGTSSSGRSCSTPTLTQRPSVSRRPRGTTPSRRPSRHAGPELHALNSTPGGDQPPATRHATAYASTWAAPTPPATGRQWDCWRIRLVSSVTWL